MREATQTSPLLAQMRLQLAEAKVAQHVLYVYMYVYIYIYMYVYNTYVCMYVFI